MPKWVKHVLLLLIFLSPFLVFVVISKYDLMVLIWPTSILLLATFLVAKLTRNQEPGKEDIFIMGFLLLGPVISLIVAFSLIKLLFVLAIGFVAFWILFKVKR